MMTRKEFGGRLLTAVAAGALANYSLVADAMSLSSLERGLNDKCNDNGKSDQCHGSGAKADNENPPVCRAPAPDAEPGCRADTCSQSDAHTGNE